MVSELLQSVKVELGAEFAILVFTALLAVTFRGAWPVKQKGSPKSPKLLELKPPHAETRGGSGAGRSCHAWNKVRQQPYHPATAQAPCHVLSQKVELLIDCASQRRDADAIAIFEEIKATGESIALLDALKCGTHRPVDVFNLLVQSALRIGRTELIQVLFGDMTSAGIKRPLAFYKSTMKVLASKKLYKEGMYVYSCLEADGLEPSPVMLSCLVSFAGELGNSESAISFFNRLAACSTPSFRDYTAILLVHSRDHNWSKSVAMLRDMQSRQAPIDNLVLNLVLSTGVAAGELDAAKALLQEFSVQDGMASVISYNTIMKGFAQHKYADQATQLLDEMFQLGMKPNAITFNTAMDACIRSLRVVDAWQVLVRMVEAGLAPDKFTCTILMKGLHCGATSQQLVVILDLMPKATQDCESTLCATMFRTVIEAIAQVNNPDLAARAIAQMIDQRVMLPPQEYQRLLKVLSFDNDGNRMEQSQKTMVELHELGKCTPCAFIYDRNGCRLGSACPRCHICPPEELSKAFEAKRAFMKARLSKARKDFRWQRDHGCEPSNLRKTSTV